MTRLVLEPAGSPKTNSPPAVAFFAPDAPAFAAGAGDGVRLKGNDVHVDASGVTVKLSLGAEPLSLQVELPSGARVYGFGAHGEGAARNGERFRVLTMDTLFYGFPGTSYTACPFFLVRSSRGCFGVLFATTFPLDVDVGARAVTMKAPCDTEGSAADVVVFHGTPAEIAADLTTLCGKTFLPPLWALGFHQSRWSYRTEHEVRAVAQTFRRLDLPADVIHLDIHYMDDYRVFTWSPERFPRPKQLHSDLKDLGFRTLAIVDPGVSVKQGYGVHDELLQKDQFLKTSQGVPYAGKVWPGATLFPDFSMEETRQTWAAHHQGMLDDGVAGFWNDMNDPVLQIATGYDPLQQDITHKHGSHKKLRSLYANQMATATVQALKTARPDKRPFVLSRSGMLGVQRHSAIWTGDNISSWAQLKVNLNMVLNLGLSGIALCGADVGGFGGRRGKYGVLKLRPSTELFVRWMELGSLLPFFRVHSVLYSPRQEPWSFGKAGLVLNRKLLRRRYRLLPLLYRLAYEAHTQGLPLARPVWMHAPDVEVGHAEDQFFLGEDLLVAPVLERGARLREVMLPAGSSWIGYESGVVHAGGQRIVVDAPLGTCPMFVRAGAARWEATAGKNAQETLQGLLSLEVSVPSPGKTGAGLLFLDDGEDARGLERSLLLRAAVQHDDGVLRVTLDAERQAYAAAPTSFELRAPRGFTQATVTTPQGEQVFPLVERSLASEDRRGVAVMTATLPLGPSAIVLA